MLTKLILSFFLLFITLFSTQAQEPDSSKTKQEPEIKLVHTAGIFTARKLKKNEKLKIQLEGADSTIVGTYTFIDDSTMLVDEKVVKFSEIEKLRTTNKTSVGIGTFLTAGGVALAGIGIVILSDMSGEDFLGQIVLGIVGGGILIIGGGCAAVGVIVLSTSSHNYAMDKWHLYVQK